MKVTALLCLEVTSLLVLTRDDSWAAHWLVVLTVMMAIMAVLILLDRSRGFVMLAGTLLFLDISVASLTEGMGVLPLWSLLAVGLFSIILGVAVTGQSRLVKGIMIMDGEQERLFLREMLRNVGISILAIVGVMVMSLGILSLTFLADLGISSAVAMAILAIVALVSMGALVALRERI